MDILLFPGRDAVVIERGGRRREVASVTARLTDGGLVIIEQGRALRVANGVEAQRWLEAQAEAATLAA